MSEQRQMKLGDRIACTGYIKRILNYYRIDDLDGLQEVFFYGEDAPSDGLGIENKHSCRLYKTVPKHFSGIFAGTTTLCTELECAYDELADGRCGYFCQKTKPQAFAVVYYASNRKRIVPLGNIEEADGDGR